jgi:plasmid stabilization system protein ParE
MSGGFDVRYTVTARDDLLRLFGFLLDRAKTAEDFDAAQFVVDTLIHAIERDLSRAPFIFRKVGESPFLRELIIPFRGSGYVALYEIVGDSHVNVLCVRHQLEDDYH